MDQSLKSGATNARDSQARELFEGASRTALAKSLVNAASAASELAQPDELQSILRGACVLYPDLSDTMDRLETELLLSARLVDEVANKVSARSDSYSRAAMALCSLFRGDPLWQLIAEEVLASYGVEGIALLQRLAPKFFARDSAQNLRVVDDSAAFCTVVLREVNHVAY